MQYVLHLSAVDIDILHSHAEVHLPNEAAALLFGNVLGHSVSVNRVELVHNEATSSRTSFMVNPEVQYQLLIDAEEQGDDLVAIFHSHPAPPFPSSRDQKNMKLNPVVWLIASKESGAWISKAYLMQDEEIIEVDLQIA